MTSQILPFYDLDDLEILTDVAHVNIPGLNGQGSSHVLNRFGFFIMKEERQRKFWGVKIKDLSNLLNQPVEIFYEVLGHLHPLDFYHLARTTKQFRALVISRKFAWLWNLVFERNPSIPPCPPDLSAPKWVDLMFSPLICDECGANRTEVRHFSRRRSCSDCNYTRFSSLVYTSDFNEPLNEEVRQYRENSDTQPLADRIEAYLISISWRQDTVDKSLEALKTDPATKDVVASIFSRGEFWSDWLGDIERRMCEEDQTKTQKIETMLERRLVAMGYKSIDIQFMYAHYHEVPMSFLFTINMDTNNPARSIRRNWYALKHKLSRLVLAAREQRVATERKNVMVTRKRTIQNIYDSHRSSIPDEVWDNLPASSELVSYEPFASMVNIPSEIPLDIDGISREVLPFIARWPPKTLVDLAAVWPSFQPPPPNPDIVDLNPRAGASVFYCAGCVEVQGPRAQAFSLHGLNTAMLHRTCPRLLPLHPFRISERGCAAAVSLVEHLKLDPQNALPEDVWELGGVFTCLSCPEERGRGAQPYVRSWRECILHFMEMDDQAHRIPSWKLLAPDEIPVMRALEEDTLLYKAENMFSLFE